VEALKDVVWRVPRSHYEESQENDTEASAGSGSCRASEGRSLATSRRLQTILVRLSNMLIDLPQFRKSTIKSRSRVSRERRAQAVDARIILAG